MSDCVLDQLSNKPLVVYELNPITEFVSSTGEKFNGTVIQRGNSIEITDKKGISKTFINEYIDFINMKYKKYLENENEGKSVAFQITPKSDSHTTVSIGFNIPRAMKEAILKEGIRDMSDITIVDKTKIDNEKKSTEGNVDESDQNEEDFGQDFFDKRNVNPDKSGRELWDVPDFEEKLSKEVEEYDNNTTVALNIPRWIAFYQYKAINIEKAIAELERMKKTSNDVAQLEVKIDKLVKELRKIERTILTFKNSKRLRVKGKVINKNFVGLPLDRVRDMIEEDMLLLDQYIKNGDFLSLQQAENIIAFYENAFKDPTEKGIFANIGLYEPNAKGVTLADELSKVVETRGDKKQHKVNTTFHTIISNQKQALEEKQLEIVFDYLMKSENSSFKAYLEALKTRLGKDKLEPKDIVETAVDIKGGQLYFGNSTVLLSASDENAFLFQVIPVIARSETFKAEKECDGYLTQLKDISENKDFKSALRSFGGKQGFRIFYNKDSFGHLTDRLINNYSYEAYDILESFAESAKKASTKNVKETLKELNKNFRQNFQIIDIFNLPEFQQGGKYYEELKELLDDYDSRMSSFFRRNYKPSKNDSKYSEKLKKDLGEEDYQREIKKQYQKLITFKNLYSELKKQEAEAKAGVRFDPNDPDNPITPEYSSTDVRESMKYLFMTRGYFTESNIDLRKANAYEFFDNAFHFIPRKYEVDDYYNHTEKISRFWNQDYDKIKNNPALKRFHNLLLDISDIAKEILPPHEVARFRMGSIPQTVGDLSFKQVPKKVNILGFSIPAYYDALLKHFTEGHQNTRTKRNRITGKFEIEPQKGKFDFASNVIETFKYHILKTINYAYLQDNNIPINRSKEGISQVKVDATTINVNKALAEIMNLPKNSSAETILSHIPENAKEGNLVNLNLLAKSYATHAVMENTFKSKEDMVGSLNVSIPALFDYKANNRQLNIVTAAIELLERQQKKDSNSRLREGKLSNTIASVKSELNRLYNSTPKVDNKVSNEEVAKHLTDHHKEVKAKLAEAEKEYYELINEDKKRRTRLKEISEELKKENITEDEKNTLFIEQTKLADLVIDDEDKLKLAGEIVKEYREYNNHLMSITRNSIEIFTVRRAFNALLKSMKIVHLTLNVPAWLRNFMEGQGANDIFGARETYFKYESLMKANQIVTANIGKFFSGGALATGPAKQVSNIMRSWKLSQEIYKNTYSIDSDIEGGAVRSKNKAVRFVEKGGATDNVEFANQASIAVAMMMEHMIESKPNEDGSVETMSLWDAFQLGQKETGKEGILGEKFRTDGNRLDYESLIPDEYVDLTKVLKRDQNIELKQRITSAISNIQGDYHPKSGNHIGTLDYYRGINAYKKWFWSHFASRFAPEVTNLANKSKKQKGRYRSTTLVSSMMVGGSIGLTFGLPGLLGASIAFGIAHTVMPKKYKATGLNKSDLTHFQELGYIGLVWMRSLVATFPISRITGKSLVGLNLRSTTGKQLEAKMKEKYGELDFYNIKSLVYESAVKVYWSMIAVIGKAIFTADDDDDKETKKALEKWRNIHVNITMSLANQSFQLLHAFQGGSIDQMRLPLIQYFSDLYATGEALSAYGTENDVITTGEDVGKSKAFRSLRKVLMPAFVRGIVNLNPMEIVNLKGLGTKPFVKIPAIYNDSTDEEEAKKQVAADRARIKRILRDVNFSSEDISRFFKTYKIRKRTEETYEQNAERIEKLKDRITNGMINVEDFIQ